MNVLEVDDLHVSYGSVHAVRGVDLAVAEGEIVGLLGANGAGKTSTLEVCEGYRPASSGAVRVLGRDPGDRDLRQQVGVVLQDVGVTPFLSVREVLTRNAAYYARPRAVADVLALVGLDGKADARVQTLSGGQQRRLDLALGILGSPRLLFLDEPTTGFDPGARRDAWQLVRDLREQGTTIVLTTHYLEEAEALADRVVVMAAGEVVAQGPPAELGGRSDGPTTVRFRVDAAAVLPPLPADDRVVRDGPAVRVACCRPGRDAVAADRLGPRRGRRARGPVRGARDARGRLPAADRVAGVSPAGLVAHQVRYEQKAYWRNPASAFFTFAFPLVFLVIFASLNNGSTIDFLGGLGYNQYYIPAIIAFSIISATYTQIGIALALRRQTGELKRFRTTPLPTWCLVAGLLGSAVLVGLLSAVLTTALGIAVYDVTLPTHYVALVLALLVGSASFCALGVAIASLVPNADAAPAVVNGVLFPVLFLSGVFFPLDPDSVLARIADVFPVRHFAQAVFAAFDPRLPAGLAHGFAWDDLAVLALWGALGAAVAVRRFRWEPRR